jgi:hypothetical protein
MPWAGNFLKYSSPLIKRPAHVQIKRHGPPFGLEPLDRAG